MCVCVCACPCVCVWVGVFSYGVRGSKILKVKREEEIEGERGRKRGVRGRKR